MKAYANVSTLPTKGKEKIMAKKAAETKVRGTQKRTYLTHFSTDPSKVSALLVLIKEALGKLAKRKRSKREYVTGEEVATMIRKIMGNNKIKGKSCAGVAKGLATERGLLETVREKENRVFLGYKLTPKGMELIAEQPTAPTTQPLRKAAKERRESKPRKRSRRRSRRSKSRPSKGRANALVESISALEKTAEPWTQLEQLLHKYEEAADQLEKLKNEQEGRQTEIEQLTAQVEADPTIKEAGKKLEKIRKLAVGN